MIAHTTLVADLLHEYPQVIAYFLQHRLACVGCCMAAFDTLADVARNYSLDLTLLVSDLTRLVSSGTTGDVRE